MIVEEKNQGPKVDYELSGNVIVFRGGELSLDLSKFERDFPVDIDISSNEHDMLQTGLSRRYVAQISIPAGEYEEIDTGETDEEDDPIIERSAMPFDISRVKLILWGLE